MTAETVPTELERFQQLLRELFQFDAAELDFGFYRILNARRTAIDAFIEQTVPSLVSGALASFGESRRDVLRRRVQEARGQVLDAFGSDAVDEAGDLREAFVETPLGRNYLDARSRLGPIDAGGPIESFVYNQLHSFFSRYYSDGDFIPQRRYGHREGFTVRHVGGDAALHWATRDQYYVKNESRLGSYRFRLGDVSVEFNTIAMEPMSDAKSADRRVFCLSEGTVRWDEVQRQLSVAFEVQIRSSPADGIAPQESENDKSERRILGEIQQWEVLAELNRESAAGRSVLRKHLSRFTRKQTTDFFVHRRLRDFLYAELDQFIQSNVLRLDDVLGGTSDTSQALLLARSIRDVARPLVDFLAQLEDFQLKLFEKRKLVLRTEYCLTLDRLPASLWHEVQDNQAQLTDWQTTLGLQLSTWSGPAAQTLDREFVSQHPYLVVDTRHFQPDFKEALLNSMEDIDSALDGTLVKSDNFQALALLLETYRGAVRCAYVDPPFNTENEQFLYKDDFKDSTWLTLMHNRLALAREFLATDGSIYVHVDHNSNSLMRLVLDELFGQGGFVNEIIWRIGWVSGYKTQAEAFVRNHETIFLYETRANSFFNKAAATVPYVSFEQDSIRPELEGIAKAWSLPKDATSSLKVTFYGSDDTVYKIGLEGKSGRYYVEDTWNSNEYERLDSNKIKRNVAEYTPNGSRLTQKPELLLKRILDVSSEPGDIVMDFFAGTGTTAAVAKKLGRKFIAVESGEYFESDLLWRMKRVLAGIRVGISSRVEFSGGGMFKYQELEQYDDTLSALELTRRAEGDDAHRLFGDEYLTQHLVDFEAAGSAPFVPIEVFAAPFDHHLPTSGKGDSGLPVDLVATFNYLAGLRVRKERFFYEAGRRYHAVLGDREGRATVVVWRATSGLTLGDALRADAVVIDQTIVPALLGSSRPDRLLVNGPCLATAVDNVEQIETEFARLMFARLG